MNPYDNAYEYPNGQEPEAEPNRVTSPDQKKNVAVAAGGTTLLAASAIGLGMMDDSDSGAPVEDGYANYESTTPIEPPLIVPVANTGTNGVTSMNDLDNLDTFDKAFAAARHLVGPGHHFTWHGNTYNTFYSEELNALTPAERQAFVATLDNVPSQPREVTPMPAQPPHAAPAHHQPEPMLAQSETAPADATATAGNVPEVVPIAATVAAANAYPEITPVDAVGNNQLAAADNGMGPHIESVDEYMGQQAVGHPDGSDTYSQAHDQISGHDLGLHMAE